MATELPEPMGDDPGFVAEITRIEEEVGPLPVAVIEARWRLRLQAHRCAAGEHVYTWAGETIDLPGSSLHQIMACAYAATHTDGTPSPRMIGPLHTPVNAAKRLWSQEELKEHAPPTGNRLG
jgi:hypothetical protein